MQDPEQTQYRKITAVLFDMDNTLFDFVEAKIGACEAVNRLLGLERTRDLLFYFLRDTGRSFEDLEHLRDFMKDQGVYSEEAFAECCRIYEDIKIRDLSPYPAIENTLAQLKERGLSLSVVTDAQRQNAIARLEKTGLYEMFDAVITSDMTGTHKPDLRVFQYALEMLGRCPEEVLMVGDSLRRDIAPAKLIGMMTAHARYGDRNFHEERIEQADVTLADISDVLQVIDHPRCL
ncbi:MAG TPA: HAD family hydrolase [Methanoregulaceae archaeon]|nr:HAD family hydrolase [Methanoregulaceae archaeon]